MSVSIALPICFLRVFRYRIQHFIGFGAPRLQAEYTLDFVNHLIDGYYIKTPPGPASQKMKTLQFYKTLEQSRATGEHTSVVLFKPHQVREVYKWHCPNTRPTGDQPPIQCSHCMAVYIWEFNQTPAEFRLTCKSCRHLLTLPKPDATPAIPGSKLTGKWFIHPV